MSQRRRTSWIDQFVLREDVNNPFVQVITAAQQLARVAEDRVGLTRAEYDEVATARYQARVLEDLARMLDEDVAGHGRRADEALASETDPVARARVMTSSLTGCVRTSAMLVDACHTLLGLAEKRATAHRRVPPGTLLVLYTDGLVERRDESVDAGIERLREVVATRGGDLEPGSLCPALAAALLPHDEQAVDDVAIVVVELLPERADAVGRQRGRFTDPKQG